MSVPPSPGLGRPRRPAGWRRCRLWSLCLLTALVSTLGWLQDSALGQAPEERPVLRVELGVEPRQVTVGDPFRSVVRVSLPPGYTVRYLEFESGDTVAATDPVDLAEAADGATVGVYPLVAWAVAPDLAARVSVMVTAPDGTSRTHEVRLQMPEVRSVLPAGVGEIAPRPPKGLITTIVPTPFPWWVLALIIGLLAAAWYVYRRLVNRPQPVLIDDPRSWALSQLDGDPIGTLMDSGEYAEAVSRTSEVLRQYIARIRVDLGMDLTTTELIGHLDPELRRAVTISAPIVTATGISRGVPAVGDGREALTRPVSREGVNDVERLLSAADRVKFARHVPTAVEARGVLAAARAWVVRFPPEPLGVAEPRRAA